MEIEGVHMVVEGTGEGLMEEEEGIGGIRLVVEGEGLGEEEGDKRWLFVVGVVEGRSSLTFCESYVMCLFSFPFFFFRGLLFFFLFFFVS